MVFYENVLNCTSTLVSCRFLAHAMGDDKPFECTVSGCGMKFTNEDHLTVHKTKHQLTLTLATSDFKTGHPMFVDQTPTPSKFLKNFEEVTLFHDFSKNPFEEAFKKAAEHPSPCADLESSATTSPSVYDTLNTPNPGFLVASVMDLKNFDQSNSSQQDHHNGHGQHQNSFLPPPSEHSFYLLPSPSCSIGTQANHQSSEWSHMEIEDHHHDPVETNQSSVGGGGTESLIYVPNGSLAQGVVNLNGHSISMDPSCITYLLANDTLVPVALPTISIDDGSLVVRGESIDAGAAAARQKHQTKADNSSSGDGRHLVKIRPSPSPLSSSSGKTPSSQSTPKNCIAMSTKEKLKAAIQNNAHQQQQQLPPSSGHHAYDASHHARQKKQATLPTTMTATATTTLALSSSSSSSSTSSWNVSYVVSNAESKEIEECEDVVGSLFTGKKICVVPVEEEKDDKRKRFLERNRAAAARCRQKKKVWMNTLAIKSEHLEASNRSMQNELKQLRREVQVLRSLLEAHKECPVTLKQEALKEEMQSDHVTSSSSSHGSGVNVVITTSDEEAAMNALSSMAACHRTG